MCVLLFSSLWKMFIVSSQLKENDGKDMPVSGQRNHKHKISSTPLYPYALNQ